MTIEEFNSKFYLPNPDNKLFEALRSLRQIDDNATKKPLPRCWTAWPPIIDEPADNKIS